MATKKASGSEEEPEETPEPEAEPELKPGEQFPGDPNTYPDPENPVRSP